jgi:hypothetical protein
MHHFELRISVVRNLFARDQQVIFALLFLSSLFALTGCGGLSYKTSGPLSDLAQISCGTQSLVGAQTKSCSIDLTAKAASAVQVSLQTSSIAVQVPATVLVQSGAQSASFDIVASNVTQPLSVTISGAAHGNKKLLTLTLYPPATPSLTNLSCGTQSLAGSATDSCSVTLSAAPTSAVIVTLKSSSSYLAVPSSVTVAAGSATGNFQATASPISSSLTATISATLGGVTVTNPIQLNVASGSGSGTQHIVNLNWSAPSSVIDLAGYHIYRAPAGALAFQLLNSTLDLQPSYADSTAASGQTYDYEVTSVSLSGAESSPSNITTVSIPN